jgi:penicillin G amidase
VAFRGPAAAVVAGGLLWLGARGAGPAPALGPVLDPWNGVWASARGAELPPSLMAAIPSLGADVQVRYDSRGVPHIFAGTVLDAYRAMGYVVARDRLFQLEVQTRATAGTLSELNPAALPLDREARRRGLAWGADRKWDALAPGDSVRLVLEAYADGVNAFIGQMRGSDLPVEYRLLGRRPMRWEPKYTYYLLSQMQQTLSWTHDDLPYLAAEAMFGRAVADWAFPSSTFLQEPIQPNGQRAPRREPRAVPEPGTGDSSVARLVGLVGAALGPRLPGTVGERSGEHGIGSNNWAVAPTRSASRHALLAGDPHLNLTLPSIWYEVHLVVPGQLDVAGVTFAGTPGVIIGFNRDAAWTYTNTGADVIDFYAESVDVAASPTKYWLDGEWKPLTLRVETFRDKSGRVLAVDTIRHTHRGPMTREGTRWMSFRWTAHETEFGAASVRSFNETNVARSVDEYWAAMAPYAVPAQNMLSADRQGTIAIRSTGKFPIRPGDGDGRRVFDGTTSASDWKGWWRVEEYPQAKNPAQGYLASANQQPIDSRTEPHYMGTGWATPWRAMRINRLLRADSAVTADAMRRYQTDPGSERVEWFVPRLLTLLDSASKRAPLSPSAEKWRVAIAAWDRRYTRDSKGATPFEVFMRALPRAVWDEFVKQKPGAWLEKELEFPGEGQLAQLLDVPGSGWWDDRATTDAREDAATLVAREAGEAWDSAVKQYGGPDDARWQWGAAYPMQVPHLLRLAPFASPKLAVQSGPNTLAPRSGASNGASWRMVVELGDSVVAQAVYPGGQSGNPFSTRYLNRAQLWADGVLEPVWTPRSIEQMPADRVVSSLVLKAPGGAK